MEPQREENLKLSDMALWFMISAFVIGAKYICMPAIMLVAVAGVCGWAMAFLIMAYRLIRRFLNRRKAVALAPAE